MENLKEWVFTPNIAEIKEEVELENLESNQENLFEQLENQKLVSIKEIKDKKKIQILSLLNDETERVMNVKFTNDVP